MTKEKEILTCKCCKQADITTMASDKLCNICFSRCKGAKECKRKEGEPAQLYSTSGSNVTSYVYKKCHEGPVKVIESQGLEIYGSSRIEAKENFYDFDLVIGLGEKVEPSLHVYAKLKSVGLERLIEKWYKQPEHIVLGWPDMGVPLLSREFWLELVEILRKKGRDRARHSNVYKVLFHCMGGHGRTGTALSIMGAFVGGWDSHLIATMRVLYCEHGVESQGQVGYIEKITGIPGNGDKGFKEASYGKDKKEKTSKENKKDKDIMLAVDSVTKANGGVISEEEKEKVIGQVNDYFKDRKKWRKDYPS